MKIAYLANAGAVHINRWTQGLAARGHEIIIISNDRFTESPEGIETIFMPGSSGASYFVNIPRVCRILKNLKPDLVHSHYATGYGLWGAMQSRAPLILTVWGTDIEDALARKSMGWMVRRTLKKAAFITAASDFLVQRTIELEKSISSHITCIPFGVPIEERGRLKKEEDDSQVIRVIYAKDYRPAYAPDIALKAFALAVGENSLLRMTMIGGGPMREELEEMAEQLGVEEQVSIRGWQNMQETAELIREADIMLMPSRKESFGVSALEAISYGVPVVASRVGGIPEIIEDGVNGILVPEGNLEKIKEGLLKLAGDVSVRQSMGLAGERIAREKFDFQICLDRMEQVYRQVATGK